MYAVKLTRRKRSKIFVCTFVIRVHVCNLMRERQIWHYASALWGNEEVIGNGVMSKYLSPAEVCKRLEGLVSEKTLANWRCSGNKGPTFIKIGGSHILYRGGW